ncbi:MAG: prolyl-tRNA editing protein [Acidiferrobacteraceae bacterium]|jgi:prolyl-tRNA editing enzyme YbaK/EbsC (Cys-tRNA(Pro) deacylase)|nr:prolyl-tRNA editing protein [Acidiferrobacteraceae bacterium]MDP6397577.1 YbaK/EbsC family protein [Arenicellales bacterium]MDP6551998.1 YbaK/EbsC family protein [Arenicellales bacterium]MDP6919109.1 YbaK/EbsC family protein [Arenicellales bacterium]|tara:strand:+ start:7527 stop:8006 length:480 start_codon:yes stop_codon:yes gene_type:complete
MQVAKHRKAKKIQEALGPDFTVLEFDQPTASATQAATAIGCTVAQIAKSLVFADASGGPILVIVSGANRVDETKVGQILGTTIHRADADFVKSATGFSIGGVPPVGHTTRLSVVLDQALRDFDEIWAAGGTPNAVFKLTPAQLKQLTGGIYCDVRSINI